MKSYGRVTNHLRNAFLLTATIIAGVFLVKLGWNRYQQNRAAKHVPEVKAIFNQIRQMPDAVGDGENDENSISVNEYSAALWRSYKSNFKCSEIRTHFDSEASRQSFASSNEYESSGEPSIEYRNGEFEIRVLCESDGYAFSVNWYGLDR